MSEEAKKLTLFDWLMASGLFVAVLGNVFQYWQNRDLQQATVQVAKVSEFKQSGTEFDKSVIAIYDALAEGKISKDHRKKLELSFIEHVLKTEEKREFLGASETEEYLAALNKLKKEVDAAEDMRGAGPRVESLARVIKIRRKISEDALGT